jgi:hypothetical protein
MKTRVFCAPAVYPLLEHFGAGKVHARQKYALVEPDRILEATLFGGLLEVQRIDLQPFARYQVRALRLDAVVPRARRNA